MRRDPVQSTLLAGAIVLGAAVVLLSLTVIRQAGMIESNDRLLAKLRTDVRLMTRGPEQSIAAYRSTLDAEPRPARSGDHAARSDRDSFPANGGSPTKISINDGAEHGGDHHESERVIDSSIARHVERLEARLRSLEIRLASPSNEAGPPIEADAHRRLAKLERDLDDLTDDVDQQAGDREDGPRATDLRRLEDELQSAQRDIASLHHTLREIEYATDNRSIKHTVQEFDNELDRVDRRLQAVEKETGARSTLGRSLSAVESQVDGLETRLRRIESRLRRLENER